MEVSRGSILDVEIISNGPSIGTNLWSFPTQHRADCARDQPVPVEVAGPEEVSTTRHAYGRAIRPVISEGQDIGARLAGIVGIPAQKRRVFRVGKVQLFAVGFVG